KSRKRGKKKRRKGKRMVHPFFAQQRIRAASHKETSVPPLPFSSCSDSFPGPASVSRAPRPATRSALASKRCLAVARGYPASSERDGDHGLRAARKLLPARRKGLPKPTERQAQASEGSVGLEAVLTRAMAGTAQEPATQRRGEGREQGEQKRVGQRRQQQQCFSRLPVPQARTLECQLALVLTPRQLDLPPTWVGNHDVPSLPDTFFKLEIVY